MSSLRRIDGEFISEPARKLPVAAQADVVVLGGGPAGICAAAAAAKQGASVLLVEKNGYLGGVATASLVCIWHSLYSINKKEKIIGGLIDDILYKLDARKALYYDSTNGKKGNIFFSTEEAKFVFDEIAIENGVRLLFHSYVSGVIKEREGSIKAVIIENKSGRSAVKGKIFVDCTGDGDVGWHAGAEYEKGNRQGKMQPPGLCVRLGNLRYGAEGQTSLPAALKNKKMDYNGLLYPASVWGVWDVHRRTSDMLIAAARMVNTDCTDAFQLSQAEVEGRRQIGWVVKTLRKDLPGFENAYIVDVADEAGPRETRRFIGDYVLTEEDLLTGRSFPDVIARGTYPVDIHNSSGGGIVFKNLDGTMHIYDERGNVKAGMWTHDGKKSDVQYYQMPYSMLLPRNMDNLMVAGRCSSMTHEAMGAVRVMVNCMQLGQAAGIGAAIAAGKGITPREVQASDVQKVLIRMGAETGMQR
jgi:hypothetical protein